MLLFWLTRAPCLAYQLCDLRATNKCKTGCIVATAGGISQRGAQKVPMPPHVSSVASECVCTNSCGKASNGLCTDGGPHSIEPAWRAACPLGHDWSNNFFNYAPSHLVFLSADCGPTDLVNIRRIGVPGDDCTSIWKQRSADYSPLGAILQNAIVSPINASVVTSFGFTSANAQQHSNFSIDAQDDDVYTSEKTFAISARKRPFSLSFVVPGTDTAAVSQYLSFHVGGAGTGVSMTVLNQRNQGMGHFVLKPSSTRYLFETKTRPCSIFRVIFRMSQRNVIHHISFGMPRSISEGSLSINVATKKAVWEDSALNGRSLNFLQLQLPSPRHFLDNGVLLNQGAKIYAHCGLGTPASVPFKWRSCQWGDAKLTFSFVVLGTTLPAQVHKVGFELKFPSQWTGDTQKYRLSTCSLKMWDPSGNVLITSQLSTGFHGYSGPIHKIEIGSANCKYLVTKLMYELPNGKHIANVKIIPARRFTSYSHILFDTFSRERALSLQHDRETRGSAGEDGSKRPSLAEKCKKKMPGCPLIGLKYNARGVLFSSNARFTSIDREQGTVYGACAGAVDGWGRHSLSFSFVVPNTKIPSGVRRIGLLFVVPESPSARYVAITFYDAIGFVIAQFSVNLQMTKDKVSFHGFEIPGKVFRQKGQKIHKVQISAKGYIIKQITFDTIVAPTLSPTKASARIPSPSPTVALIRNLPTPNPTSAPSNSPTIGITAPPLPCQIQVNKCKSNTFKDTSFRAGSVGAQVSKAACASEAQQMWSTCGHSGSIVKVVYNKKLLINLGQNHTCFVSFSRCSIPPTYFQTSLTSNVPRKDWKKKYFWLNTPLLPRDPFAQASQDGCNEYAGKQWSQCGRGAVVSGLWHSNSQRKSSVFVFGGFHSTTQCFIGYEVCVKRPLSSHRTIRSVSWKSQLHRNDCFSEAAQEWLRCGVRLSKIRVTYRHQNHTIESHVFGVRKHVCYLVYGGISCKAKGLKQIQLDDPFLATKGGAMLNRHNCVMEGKREFDRCGGEKIRTKVMVVYAFGGHKEGIYVFGEQNKCFITYKRCSVLPRDDPLIGQRVPASSTAQLTRSACDQEGRDIWVGDCNSDGQIEVAFINGAGKEKIRMFGHPRVCRISYHRCNSKSISKRVVLSTPAVPTLARAQYNAKLCFLDAQARFDACGTGSIVEALFSDGTKNTTAIRVFKSPAAAFVPSLYRQPYVYRHHHH